MITSKGILFLSLFLVPCTMVSKNVIKSPIQIDAQIQELEEKIYQKELELSNLSEMIAQKDERLLALNSDCQTLLECLRDNRIIQLKNQNGGNSLSQEDEKRVVEEVENQANEFLNRFYGALKDNKPIEGMLVEGLFQKGKNNNTAEFESLKFYLIRRIFDQQMILNLVKKYEVCITEYRALLNELSDLQKQQNIQMKAPRSKLRGI